MKTEMAFKRGLGSWDGIDAAADAAVLAHTAATSIHTPDINTLPEEGRQSDTTGFLSKEFRFQPRRSEALIISRLSDQINKLVTHIFGEADRSIERFYKNAALENGGHDFSRLSGEELEAAILSIQRSIYLAADQVSQLYNDAYFASRVQEDEYWESYRKPVDGDQKDRQAFAYRETKDSRYFYYYRFMLYKRLSDRLNSLKDLLKTLEFFRSRALKDRIF